jgi:2-keto-4-pentenoate hydratase/2-oxohepta-3-ene-1,7-dioic acid hydratase in catechol pathway
MRFLRYQSSSGPAYGVLDTDGTVRALEGSPLGEHHVGAVVGPMASLHLLPPVESPTVICVGMNYADHVAESHAKMPEFPLYFLKPRTALVGHGDPIVYPRDSSNVHYEAELTVVIGRRGRRIPEAEALGYVLGYTCANDVSARDWQRKEMAEGFLMHGKGFDTFAPIGPVVDTDVDASDLAIELRLNGEVKQKSRTSQLIFSVPRLIADLSQFMTLEPGDVILTGTTSGVGPVRPGDRVEVDIEGIGVLHNPVIADEGDERWLAEQHA